MLPSEHGLARDRAAHFGLLWHVFADQCATHLSSLDPHTDRLPIVRWYNRWQTALRRGRLAQLKARYHAGAARTHAPLRFDPLWSAEHVEDILWKAGLR